MLMFLRCVIPILVLAATGDATSCPSKTLIMSELETKDFAVEVIKKMRKYQAADPRLSETVLATVLYSIERHTEFLVPWSSNLTQIEQRIANFQKPGSHSSFQLPQGNSNGGETSSSTSSLADRTRPKKKRQGHSVTDPLIQQVNLGLRFFRQNEAGMILLLTSTASMAEDTKLTDKVLDGRNITLVIGFTLGNEYLESREPAERLKFVEITHDAKVKESSIARFLLYSNCTPPELVKELQTMRGVPTKNSAVDDSVGDEYSTTDLPGGSTLAAESDRKSTFIAAGSVAAASAGVAAVSVFAGRWFYGRRSNGDSDNVDSNYSHRHPAGEIPFDPTGERGYETPVAHDQSSLDIDSHTTPEIRRTDTDSSVQHIAFTMF